MRSMYSFTVICVFQPNSFSALLVSTIESMAYLLSEKVPYSMYYSLRYYKVRMSRQKQESLSQVLPRTSELYQKLPYFSNYRLDNYVGNATILQIKFVDFFAERPTLTINKSASLASDTFRTSDTFDTLEIASPSLTRLRAPLAMTNSEVSLFAFRT